jgi:hypothetical protein
MVVFPVNRETAVIGGLFKFHFNPRRPERKRKWVEDTPSDTGMDSAHRNGWHAHRFG